MKFSVSAALSYNVKSPATFIVNVHAIKDAAQIILNENFAIDGNYPLETFTAPNDNRYIRFEVKEPAYINLNYSALIETSFQQIETADLEAVSVMQTDPAVLPYFYPSRYCQNDRLFRFADNKFGRIKNPFEKVQALTDWIYEHVEYLSGSTTSQTSAFDTVTELAGVCRDFAHLGIALCRALDIPARYFTGYSFQLNPPDFHACFEAFIGGHWIIFDATKLAPLNGLVKIATGRDAADAAIATIFGDVDCTFTSASCLLADSSFEPFHDKDHPGIGITYS